MIVQSHVASANCFKAFGTARRNLGRRTNRISCYQSTDKQTAKQNLRFAIGPTQRGGSATRQQRGVVLEAQVQAAFQAYQGGY